MSVIVTTFRLIIKVNTVIDIGNSRIKIGIFDGREMEKFFSVETGSEAIEILEDFDHENLLISSVKKKTEWVKNLTVPGTSITLNSNTNLPIEIEYLTPETLGVDRIGAAVGAWLRYPQNYCLIIDVGTCITYDLIDDQGCFKGGSISPGIKMKLRSIHDFTSKLPLIENWSEEIYLTGKSTKDSILSGILLGTKQEIEGFIRSYQDKIANLRIVFTGGGYPLVKNLFKHEYYWFPHLVLEGLNGILEYNAKGGI